MTLELWSGLLKARPFIRSSVKISTQITFHRIVLFNKVLVKTNSRRHYFFLKNYVYVSKLLKTFFIHFCKFPLIKPCIFFPLKSKDFLFQISAYQVQLLSLMVYTFLAFGCWLFDHVIYLILRKKKISSKLGKFTKWKAIL